ncbi:helix-turn-helix domain-containing protein [Candidatus Peregrinibacteria bacterium]|nr:MAG: helix-turn-helix domain-containing protein [Candidatus Peregrinibacteria bacterium]
MTTESKQDVRKEQLISQLGKMPIVRAACEKMGVSRATYYRWLRDDDEFREAAEKALQGGKDEVNDVAEAQLIKAIQSGNMTGIIYWLKNHHIDYNSKLAQRQLIQRKNDVLNKTETEVLQKALKLLNTKNSFTPSSNE